MRCLNADRLVVILKLILHSPTALENSAGTTKFYKFALYQNACVRVLELLIAVINRQH